MQRLFALAGAHLPAGGVLALYGPFNYGGSFTSDSNRAFDAWLRQRDAASGIRHFEDIVALGVEHGLALEADNAMPANNRLLVFRRERRPAHRLAAAAPAPAVAHTLDVIGLDSPAP